MAKQALSLAECFSEIEDPRIERTKHQLLVDVLCLAVLAVIAGAEGWEEIEEFGRQKQTWLKKFLRLPRGIPSHDTISRVFRQLKPAAFHEGFSRWIASLEQPLGLRQVAIDGKTLRRSHDRPTMKSALHAVCAWSVANRVVLGQQSVDEKSNEIAAIPELLKLLELKGAIVTIDAMGCQKEIAAQIVEGGGDYVLAVKDNQRKLAEALRRHFDQLHETNFADATCRRRQTKDQSHGRVEQRYYYQSPLPESLRAFAQDWSELKTIGQVVSITQRDGKECSEVRYYISSLRPGVQRFAEAVRGHWAIENSLHSRARRDLRRGPQPHSQGLRPRQLRPAAPLCHQPHQAGHFPRKRTTQAKTSRLEQ